MLNLPLLNVSAAGLQGSEVCDLQSDAVELCDASRSIIIVLVQNTFAPWTQPCHFHKASDQTETLPEYPWVGVERHLSVVSCRLRLFDAFSLIPSVLAGQGCGSAAVDDLLCTLSVKPAF